MMIFKRKKQPTTKPKDYIPENPKYTDIYNA
jgi:hypothetical protein